MKVHFTTVLTTLCCAVISVNFGFSRAAESTSKAWNGYRGPNRDGLAADEDIKPFSGRPKLLWSARLGTGYSVATVFDGKVYTMGHVSGRDVIYCLDAATGKRLWAYGYPCREDVSGYRGPRGSAAVNANFVYTVSNVGHMFCLSAETGKAAWARKASDFGCRVPRWGISCSPLISGRLVIYDLGKIIALNGANGRPIWQSPDYGASYSSPMKFDVGVHKYIAAFPARGLLIVDAANGRPRGFKPWRTKYEINAAMPIVSDNKIFISSGYGRGCALFDMAAGLRKVYENTHMSNHFNSCVLHNGFLYGISGQANGDGRLVCMKFDNGRVAWTQGGTGTGSLMIAGDTIVILSEKGELILARADWKRFNLLARAKVLGNRCWTMPTVHDSKIYCRDEMGNLVCIDASG